MDNHRPRPLFDIQLEIDELMKQLATSKTVRESAPGLGGPLRFATLAGTGAERPAPSAFDVRAQAHHGAWLTAMVALGIALKKGMNREEAQDLLGLIHEGLAAEVAAESPIVVDALFRMGSLTLVRLVTVLATCPDAPLQGREHELLVAEGRRFEEIVSMFVDSAFAALPSGFDAQVGHLQGLLARARDPSVTPADRASAQTDLAPFAIDASDFKGATRLAAAALGEAPTDPMALVTACFMWVILVAAANEGRISPQNCPAWLAVVAVLNGALDYETRFPVTTTAQAGR